MPLQSLRPEAATASMLDVSRPVAGFLGGIVGGAAYLSAQVAFTALAGGSAAAPLQRIAAILMGPDAAAPAELNFTVFGMALIIHFGLSIVYGQVICSLVWGRRASAVTVIGSACGLALFVLNFGALAPLAFPWFAESIRLVTVVDHVLFGAVTGAVCTTLHQRSERGVDPA
jgi:hypothetical protein